MRGCAIYDDINARYLSIFSALCLRDALHGPSRLSGSNVISCSFGPYSKLECLQQLAFKTMETINHFNIDDLANIVKNNP